MTDYPVEKYNELQSNQLNYTTDYTVSVKTSDIFGAGTDAKVFVQLIGKISSSQCVCLKKSLNHHRKFERNHSDVFLFPNVEGFGDIERVKIWHDNTGSSPSWHLEIVEIYDSFTNTIFSFPCDRWLAKDENDGEVTRVLSCAGKRQKIPKHYRMEEQQIIPSPEQMFQTSQGNVQMVPWQKNGSTFPPMQMPVIPPQQQMDQIVPQLPEQMFQTSQGNVQMFQWQEVDGSTFSPMQMPMIPPQQQMDQILPQLPFDQNFNAPQFSYDPVPLMEVGSLAGQLPVYYQPETNQFNQPQY